VKEIEVRRALRRWVESKAAGSVVLDDQTPLIASRLITSLQITDLLLLIEELREESIDPASLRPGVFRDIDTIYATFFTA
jgi:hypothetical protein